MAWLSALGAFIGKVLAEWWPAIVEVLRRPRRTEQVGGDKDLEKEVNDDVEDQLH